MRLFDVPDLINSSTPSRDPNRSPGLHVSPLIEAAARRLGYLEESDGWDDGSVLRLEIGQAWEDRLGKKLEERLPGLFVYHPGEISKDGIAGTPDGLQLLTENRRPLKLIHEIKVTWISPNSPKVKHREGLIPWYNLHQMMSYCVMEGDCTQAVLHRLYINGNYKPPKPFHWSIGIEFSPQELDSCWNNVILSEKEQYLLHDSH